jgi:putative nucleotidyltransferase with HDIG domain
MHGDTMDWLYFDSACSYKPTRVLVDLHMQDTVEWSYDAASDCSERSVASATELQILRTFTASYDRDTYTHSRRIAKLAQKVAQHLNLSSQQIYLIYLAALLHDIGKVDIPSDILYKCGPLDDEEWKIMRLHPQIGHYKLIRAGGFFHKLAPIVLAHHERWDGKGYPLGLKREEIPIEARILSVVDSYDAMTSDRCYREATPWSESCRELQRGANSQYDPRVVNAFLHVLGITSTQTTQLAFSLLTDVSPRITRPLS